MLFKNTAKKLTFNTFLSGTPARDYIMQDTPYADQIAQAVNMIKDADYVLLGAAGHAEHPEGSLYRFDRWLRLSRNRLCARRAERQEPEAPSVER